jgi:hypothetical protein
MEIRPIGVELIHVDRQIDRRTDMRNLTAALRDYVNVSTNEQIEAELNSIYRPTIYVELFCITAARGYST